jgi:hypothetical protein
MRVRNLLAIISLLLSIAAGPATNIKNIADVETLYQAHLAAAQATYEKEVAKADEERLSNLQSLLVKATNAGDTKLMQTLQAKIDDLKADAPGNTGPHKIVYLCQATGSMLSAMGALKQQLKESVNALDGQEFNIIFFQGDVVLPLFKEGTRPASADNKKLAIPFIDKVVASDSTKPVAAINFALREKPDVLYLLTDGFPSIAKFDDVPNAFKQGNRDGKVHVNCIFLQSDSNPALETRLKQITKDGHGDFKMISKKDM